MSRFQLRFFAMLAFFVDGNLNENFIHFQKSSLEISIYKNRSTFYREHLAQNLKYKLQLNSTRKMASYSFLES